MVRPDVLLVSLGSTAGLCAADSEFAGALRRAGASVEVARAAAPREGLRTLAVIDLAWARAARAAALSAGPAGAVVYSTTTAALFGPWPGAIRFDALSAVNRPGRHGVWQRPLEARRLRSASLLLPWAQSSLEGSPIIEGEVVVCPVPVVASGGVDGVRDVAAVTYAASPEKKGLERVMRAFSAVRRPDEELLVAGADPAVLPILPDGVRSVGRLEREEYRALLRRARVFVTAPRREDYGIAQLEALADGCRLVTTPAPGPYAALPIARALDPRLVVEGDAELAAAIRTALDEDGDRYAAEAREALAPFTPEAIDALVAHQVLPRLAGRNLR
ncbi:MAG: glycosyltransferase [Solirubrobacteraceae bacterium]|nr:glycosyltransferase [Solirubrobacteraceae bacterium]